jgi:hypothetical protein
MSDEDGEGAVTRDDLTLEHPTAHRVRDPAQHQSRRLPTKHASAAPGSVTIGGIAILAILAAVGAILIARRKPARQFLIPDLRTAPSRWWRSVADAERNLASDLRHYFEK